MTPPVTRSRSRRSRRSRSRSRSRSGSSTSTASTSGASRQSSSNFSSPPCRPCAPAPPETPGPLGSEVRASRQRSAVLSPPPTTPRNRPTSSSRRLFGTPVSPPPRQRTRHVAVPLVSPTPVRRSGSTMPNRSQSQGRPRRPSPVRLEEALTQTQQHMAETQQQMAETQAQIQLLTNAVQTLAAQPPPPNVPAPAPAAVQGPPDDPAFDWARLRQPVETHFPPATMGAVQRLCAGLLAKLPTLTGRDHHEVAFVLSMAASYPEMEEEDRNIAYQRLNLLYIATHHGWAAAIAASSATTGSVPIFPPGFELPARQPTRGRRPTYIQPAQQQQAQPQQQQQQARGGRGRGNRRGGRRN